MATDDEQIRLVTIKLVRRPKRSWNQPNSTAPAIRPMFWEFRWPHSHQLLLKKVCRTDRRYCPRRKPIDRDDIAVFALFAEFFPGRTSAEDCLLRRPKPTGKLEEMRLFQRLRDRTLEKVIRCSLGQRKHYHANADVPQSKIPTVNAKA